MESDVHLNLSGESDICVVAFASGGGDFSGGLPHFEFGRSLTEMGVDSVLFRDSTGFSHLYGVQGIGGRSAVSNFIRYYLCSRYVKVKLIGLSVGALAALAYGVDLVDCRNKINVIALSPFTSLGDNPDVVFGEGWRERCPFPYSDKTHPQWIDLKPLYDRYNFSHPNVQAFISDGEGTDQDRHHAERIGITDITLVPGTSHAGLGKLMRDNGMLKQVILG